MSSGPAGWVSRRVVARLAQVRFEAVAVASTRGHCDLRLQHRDERLLRGMRLTQILHDLLFSLVHRSPAFLGASRRPMRGEV
jgi:hypothetical protein